MQESGRSAIASFAIAASDISRRFSRTVTGPSLEASAEACAMMTESELSLFAIPIFDALGLCGGGASD